MSNVIKSYTIRYKEDNKITIDFAAKDEELQAKRSSLLAQTQTEEGFEDGLQAYVVDPIVTEEEQQKKAELIVEMARKEAEAILEAAKDEVKKLKEEAIENAEKQGYEEGLRRGEQEIQQLKSSLIEQKELQKQEYQEIIEGIQGQVTELIISLITKLTGIFVEDKADIILYLVEKALADDDSKDSYTLRVSSDDKDIIFSKKEYIEGIIGREIQITVDPQLGKNQCLIETENKIIDCSLDVQLNNLITDLKLLSSV